MLRATYIKKEYKEEYRGKGTENRRQDILQNHDRLSAIDKGSTELLRWFNFSNKRKYLGRPCDGIQQNLQLNIQEIKFYSWTARKR